MSIRIPPSAEIEISDGHSAAAYAVCPGQKPRISVRQRKILKIRFMELLEKIAAMFTRRGGCFDVSNPIGTADLKWIFARNREGNEPLRYKSVKRFFSNSISSSFFILESSADRALLSTAR